MGGPYREKPTDIKGVKLAPEINAGSNVILDIPDFGIPTIHAVDDAVYQSLKILCNEGEIYIGCMGGIGRTGMFMAILIKTIGILNLEAEEKTRWFKFKRFFGGSPNHSDLGMRNFPVEWVRDEYLSTAVETDEQYSFVSRYDPEEMLDIRDRISNCMESVR